VKTGMKLHDLGDLEGYSSHIRNGLGLVEAFGAVRDSSLAVDNADIQWLRATALALNGNRAGALDGWDRATGALESVVKQRPADAHLRDEFLVLLHATVLVLGNHADPGSELRVSETVMRSLEEVTSGSDDRQAAGDFGLILTIRGRALIASGESAKALECYRKALKQATALLERSARNPLAGFVLASVLLEFTSTFRSEPAVDALNRYRKYLDAARDSSAADPVNAEARGTLYARLSDMAEILDNTGDKEASKFHQQAAQLAGDLGTQLSQSPPVSTEWGARQRFYHLRAADSPANAAGIGFRYSVLQWLEGAWVEVDSAKEFHTDDRVRIRIEPNTDGYFFIASRGTSGTWSLFYPRPGDLNTAWSKQPMFLPPGSQMRFDNRPGIEQIYIVFSKVPRPEWVAAIGPSEKPAAAIEELIQLLRQHDSKPQIEMVGKETSVNAPASHEHALYAAQASSDAGRPLIFSVQLKHGL
jgi:tetratricopeptide (TPR) repeat protein